ncbi:MAG: hypothetical protein ABUL69_01665, partial [Peristeroidobacter soli]
YAGPIQFTYPRQWDGYVGHYRSDNPWIGSLRVSLRKGRLWLNGVVPLEQQGDLFYLRDEDHSPEWVRFGEVVNERCLRMTYSGEDLRRVFAT